MAELKDYWNGWNYVDADGDIISQEEAQAEVEWRNGKEKQYQKEIYEYLDSGSKEKQCKNTN